MTADARAAARRRRSGVVRLLWEQSYGIATVVALVAAWEVATWVIRIPSFVLPPPLLVFSLIIGRWALFLRQTLPTAREVLLGFAASVIIGIPIAVGIVYSKTFQRVSYTVIVASQAIPKTALAPLFVLWFGYGLLSKVAVAFLIAFFPIVVNTVIGMQSVEPEMLYLGQSIGATPLQIFVNIRFPRALPSIFAGLKVAITLAVVGAVVGEYIASNAGLGYLQLAANADMNTPLLFATIVVLSMLGIILFNAVGLLERAVIRWKPGEAQLESVRETM